MIKKLFLVSTVLVISLFGNNENSKMDLNIVPFGIKLADIFDKNILLKSRATSNKNLKMVSPPKPVSFFNRYAVTLNDSNVVVDVRALSKSYENDRYCYGSQGDFSKLEKALTKKYGNPKEAEDRLMYDSSWDDAKYYQTSLEKNERVHYSQWILESVKIELAERANRDGCYLTLMYFDNKLSELEKNKNEQKDMEAL